MDSLGRMEIISPQDLLEEKKYSQVPTIVGLIEGGKASIVGKEDWRVDREAPPFVEVEELIRFLNNCNGKPRVIHLGMGDGSANEAFKRSGKDHTSVCVADNLYIDPRDIIDAFLINALHGRQELTGDTKLDNETIGTRQAVARVLRSELLIPASIHDITATSERKLPNFQEKDDVIRRIFAKALQEAGQSQTLQSFSQFKAITKILTENPQILLPEQFSMGRNITKLGQNISKSTVISPNQKEIIEEVVLHVRKIFPHDPNIITTIIAERLTRMLLNCDTIVRGKFEHMEDLLPEYEEESFDYIDGTRADAFLHEQYGQFLKTIVRFLKKNGLYISDGIVSAYKYLMHYKELKDALDEIAQHNDVQIILQTNPQTDMPPTYVTGLTITKRKDDAAKTFNLKPGYIRIPYDDFEKHELSKKQMAWTYLFSTIVDYNAEMSSRELAIDIERIDPQIVETIINDIVSEFDSNLFKIATNEAPKEKQDLDKFLKEILQELKTMTSCLIY